MARDRRFRWTGMSDEIKIAAKRFGAAATGPPFSTHFSSVSCRVTGAMAKTYEPIKVLRCFCGELAVVFRIDGDTEVLLCPRHRALGDRAPKLAPQPREDEETDHAPTIQGNDPGH